MIEFDLMMTREEVRTIFSVYRIWQQEAPTPAAAERRGVTDAMRIVERRLTPAVPAKSDSEVAHGCHPESRRLMAS